MVETSPVLKEDRDVLRWGGLAGIGGAVLFVLVFAIVSVFAGPDPAGPAGPITRFPDIAAVRTVENGLYLAVLVFWVPLFLALYRGLRRTGPAPALFGSGLGVVGLGVLAAGAIPHIATSRLADLYHEPGATDVDRAALVHVWQATQGVFDAMLAAGLLVTAVGIILVGMAMLGDPAVGKVIGRVSVALGIVGLIAGIVVLVDSASVVAAVGFFALIAFHALAGWTLVRMSRTG
jgi:hypothetical protein